MRKELILHEVLADRLIEKFKPSKYDFIATCKDTSTVLKYYDGSAAELDFEIDISDDRISLFMDPRKIGYVSFNVDFDSTSVHFDPEKMLDKVIELVDGLRTSIITARELAREATKFGGKEFDERFN